MAYSFATAEVEDGTGKSTALVYEQPATGITWLNSRGKTSFSAASDALQEQYAQEAVEECEDAIRGLMNGSGPIDPDQALIFPSRGAYSLRGLVFDEDELPAKLNEAIRLAEEEKAAGTWRPGLGAAGIEAESSARGSIEYYEGAQTGEIESDHPDVWRRLRAVAPPAQP